MGSCVKTPEVHIHGRRLTTPFGLLGIDENALSFAFGYTLSKCPDLLRYFLRHIGLGGLRTHILGNLEISLQRHGHGQQGVTDIELYLPGMLYVVVEAKIGMSIPTLEQCEKYLPRFKHHSDCRQRLVALVASPATSLLHAFAASKPDLPSLLTTFQWMELIPVCIQLLATNPATTEAGRWLRAFHQFLDREYVMRAFTEEVWIVSASTQPLWPNGMSYYDTHVNGRIYYRTDCHAKRPLYIAFRVGGKVTHIQKVLGVEHETRPADFVADLQGASLEWATQPHTIWKLGVPTPLPSAIPTDDKAMRGRQFSCDLDILISSASIREAVQRMKTRDWKRG